MPFQRPGFPILLYQPPGEAPIVATIYIGEDGRGGIKESMYTDRGMEVAIDFLVYWKDRIKVLYLLRGSCGYDGQNYWRRLPLRLPPRIGMDEIAPLDTPDALENNGAYDWTKYVCTSIGECRPVEPATEIGQDNGGRDPAGWPYYDKVIIPTKWSVPLYAVLEDPYPPSTIGLDPSGFPYTTTRWRTAGEIFSPYTNAYRFKNEATPANEANVGILRAKTELSITRHFMPFVDTLSLDGLIGKINMDPITISTDTNPPESILYLGYDAEPYINPSNGKIVYDVTHRMMVNGPVPDKDGVPQESWNYFMNRSGFWDVLVQRDGGGNVYTDDEFKCKIWPEYVDCLQDPVPPPAGGGPAPPNPPAPPAE